MAKRSELRFSGPVRVFQEQRLPEKATPAGYSALINAFGLSVPLPRTLCAIGEHHRVYEKQGWRIFTPRHAPHPSLSGHLTFALKYEGLDLAVLKRLFLSIGPEAIKKMVQATPTGGYARRIWFLYEWLTGEQLDLPAAGKGAYVPVVDPHQQWAVKGANVSRQRVRNNLPGTPVFCPLVFRSQKLETLTNMDLSTQARAVVDKVPRDVLVRTAAFLLLLDSKASYAIEGERPPQDRIQRWSRVIGEAGRHDLDQEELLRLQGIIIGDDRFVKLGFRTQGGFVGQHDRQTQMPLPDHISARPEDIDALIKGVVDFDQGPGQELDSVLAAAVLAFGFIYIHPFEDGNGRIHRYLIHHVLAQKGFTPRDAVFPISAVIMERIVEYRRVLEDYSRRLLPVVQWTTTQKNNVRVLNDTADFYRFFDATPQVEFLYDCVRKTIEEDLPRETDFLRRHDAFQARVKALVDMPDRLYDLLFRFLQQNDGSLSQRARQKEFSRLTEQEVQYIEQVYNDMMSMD